MARRAVDWTRMARKLGTIITETENGYSEHGSDELAREAVALLIGDAALRDAVDFWVFRPAPGSELARNVLQLLRPWSAMQRCHEIYLERADLEDRRSAICLLRSTADHRVLPWVPQYLADPDRVIRAWGIGILDYLVLSGLDHDECVELLAKARKHEDPHVRAEARRIQRDLGSAVNRPRARPPRGRNTRS